MTAIKMENITKSFGKFKANDNISLSIEKGEIHAILGENGAGKSTLMNILFGLYSVDAGNIYINGEVVNISSPTIAQAYKIGMVHQHFMLVDTFSIVENIVLGNEETKKGKLYLKKAKEVIQGLVDKYNFSLNIDSKIRNLTVGEKQRVEILKVLYSGAQILIFDEPTAVLTPQEVEQFINILIKLKKEGKTIVLITHKLSEIKKVADQCTIIRKGKTVGTKEVANISEQELATLMVGQELHLISNTQKSYTNNKVLEVSGLSYKNDKGILKLNSLNLKVNSGEILGIAGVDNNGQKELVDAILGVIRPTSGDILYFGNEKEEQLSKQSIKEINDQKISCIPEDRIKEGIISEYDIAQNSVLKQWYKPEFSKYGFMKKEAIKKYGEHIWQKYDVRSSQGLGTSVKNLSGGNQQKLIVGREIEVDSKIIIAFQPTRGVDVGAINFIHKKLIEQRDKGKAIILISMELSEVIALSDKIAVIHNGEIMDIVKSDEVSREEVGLMMAGKRRKR